MTEIFKILFCVILTFESFHSQDLGNPPVRPSDAKWEEVCILPKEIGECKAAVTKYYYNADKNICESFTYGGCGGNYNNFETLIECTAFCGRGGGLLQAPAQPPMPNFNRGGGLLEVPSQPPMPTFDRGGGLLEAPQQPPMPTFDRGGGLLEAPLQPPMPTFDRGGGLLEAPLQPPMPPLNGGGGYYGYPGTSQHEQPFEENAGGPPPETIYHDNSLGGSSGGNRPKWKQNWPIFGGLFAGIYSLARDLLYW